MVTACSPVLLPARVVQALNLNVHNNGIHISPRSGLFFRPLFSFLFFFRPLFKCITLNKVNNFKYIIFVLNVEIRENDSKKKSKMVATPMNMEVETPIDSPEKLLPEEWIY